MEIGIFDDKQAYGDVSDEMLTNYAYQLVDWSQTPKRMPSRSTVKKWAKVHGLDANLLWRKLNDIFDPPEDIDDNDINKMEEPPEVDESQFNVRPEEGPEKNFNLKSGQWKPNPLDKVEKYLKKVDRKDIWFSYEVITKGKEPRIILNQAGQTTKKMIVNDTIPDVLEMLGLPEDYGAWDETEIAYTIPLTNFIKSQQRTIPSGEPEVTIDDAEHADYEIMDEQPAAVIPATESSWEDKLRELADEADEIVDPSLTPEGIVLEELEFSEEEEEQWLRLQTQMEEVDETLEELTGEPEPVETGDAATNRLLELLRGTAGAQ